MNILIGCLIIIVIYAIITALHFVLPGRWHTGYIDHVTTGQKLQYRLNGLLVLVVSISIWYGLGYYGVVDYDILYHYRWWTLSGAIIMGLIYSALMVFPYPKVSTSLIKDYFLGRQLNPQIKNGHIDHKMWLYLIGAVMLILNILSFLSYHISIYSPDTNTGVYLCTGMTLWFVLDYLTFEHVHLYTYDIFAERVGFKLGWGCLAFYPFFYSISMWSVVDIPNPGMQLWQLIGSGVIFMIGWMLARGANLQKYYFKTTPDRSFLGITPLYIEDGNRKLLINGFWGVSRHVNYLGEILMGIGIASSVGQYHIIWPWLYPLYYVLLLVPRQIDDDKRCKKKYGPLWEQYIRKVKYRIIPGIY